KGLSWDARIPYHDLLHPAKDYRLEGRVCRRSPGRGAPRARPLPIPDATCLGCSGETFGAATSARKGFQGSVLRMAI
ncbi:MAG: hypothetical protein MUE60_08610, partial [Candidatus Eisenbacteria bacterium]|nr:hypothetical protein [Candidatus Eisenbacteria bacterium]